MSDVYVYFSSVSRYYWDWFFWVSFVWHGEGLSLSGSAGGDPGFLTRVGSLSTRQASKIPQTNVSHIFFYNHQAT